MKLVVNDASVLIDIIDARLFDEFLQLGIYFHITNLVLNELEDEYEPPVAESIRNETFIAHNLTAKELSEIDKLKKSLPGGISQPDTSCLFLAKKINATILTGDKAIRRAAIHHKVKVHGSLWVLGQLIEASIITKKTAAKRLVRLMDVNPRLPKRECARLLERWGK
jgi:predicted nucleic acid-binding protein